jgi:hypothetical protein
MGPDSSPVPSGSGLSVLNTLKSPNKMMFSKFSVDIRGHMRKKYYSSLLCMAGIIIAGLAMFLAAVLKA